MRSTAVALGAVLVASCADTAGESTPTTSDAGAAEAFEAGTELRVTVPPTGRAYVKLSLPAVASEADWDLAFEGYEVFTNGGASGGGKGAAFGPLDTVTFLGDVAPSVPFLTNDKTGGAFLDWYVYEGSTHALWSRFHVYGVVDGDRRWKVQLLGYYGERDGAPISALYKLRAAEIGGDGVVRELDAIDGTAGGAAAPEAAPSACVDLGTGTRMMVSPAEARASRAWHLCFRRSSISVNGELGGPRGVTAVDLDAAGTAAETLDVVRARTAETERARFDAVGPAAFDGAVLRGDRVVSAFGDAWLDRKRAPLAPTSAAWLVQDAAGDQKYLVGFAAFESPTTTSPGTIVMRIKPVKG